MTKRSWIITLLALVILFGLNGHSAQAQSASAIFQAINQFRSNNGLPPFQYNSALANAAQNQANYMAEFHVYSNHTGYGGSTPYTRAVAAGYNGRVSENIVGGTQMSAARGLNWWINSPVHYGTLITTRYVEAGTGFATDGDQNFYVLVVGTPSDAPPAELNVDDSPEPLIITPITLAEPNEDGSIVHVVQEGQALWSLAAHYEVPLNDLRLFNGLEADAYLQPGDKITIRLADGADPPPTPTPPTMHTVREGQSLWSIAALYDIKFGDILWLNNLTEDTVLRPGDEIKVRLAPGEAPPPTPTPIVYHSVRSGQTLWDIAITYNLTLDELLAFNDNLDQNSLLHVGDQILVRMPVTPPTSTATPAATAVPSPTPSPTTTPIPADTPMTVAQATPAPTTVQSPAPVTNTAAARVGQSLWLGILLMAVGLTALAGVVIVLMRREQI